ncbi:LysM domain-containing protein [Streptococcus pneumoniae]|nr:LysM domain-containing protein [Streptococcus pneumoniae]
MKKRMLLASTVALSFAPVLATQAEEVLWTARSVEQIQNDLTKTDNKTSYTVQYGDTLSTIAEALGVDVTVLANLNKITNMDLIFPETVLTTTVNEAEEVTEVEIQTPQADSSEEVTTATADLTTNQVTVDDQTVQVADLSQPIAEVTKTVIASEELAHPSVSSLFKNQGIYKDLLGVFLLYGIYFSQNLEIVTIFVLFVIGAATYGSLTADKKIILKQGGSAILALISILLFKYT